MPRDRELIRNGNQVKLLIVYAELRLAVAIYNDDRSSPGALGGFDYFLFQPFVNLSANNSSFLAGGPIHGQRDGVCSWYGVYLNFYGWIP